jgi:hypothetical protein
MTKKPKPHQLTAKEFNKAYLALKEDSIVGCQVHDCGRPFHALLPAINRWVCKKHLAEYLRLPSWPLPGHRPNRST